GLDDLVGRRKVRLADLQVDDALALGLQLACPRQDLERAFRAEARHPLRESHSRAHLIRILVDAHKGAAVDAECLPGDVGRLLGAEKGARGRSEERRVGKGGRCWWVWNGSRK